MTKLVTKLRELNRSVPTLPAYQTLLGEAADEIERLQTENANLRSVIDSRDRALGFVPLSDEPSEDDLPPSEWLLFQTGPWNENRFVICRGTEKVEGDHIADFTYREDAELFLKAKQSAVKSGVNES